MKPDNAYVRPIGFSDFGPEYIESIAAGLGAAYEAEAQPSADESGLYNNEKTDAHELFKLTMHIGGLECEAYTAEYFPITSAGLEALAGPREYRQRYLVQVFSVTLPYAVESLYVESMTNVTLTNMLGMSSVNFMNTQKVSLEGDFNSFFRVHAPPGGELQAFTILAPNVMQRMLVEAGDYDFEFAGHKVYFYRQFKHFGERLPITQAEYDAFLKFGIGAAEDMARAARPAKVPDILYVEPLWRRFDTASHKPVLALALFFVGFFVFLGVLVTPTLWPVLLLIALIVFGRYVQLKSRRARLRQNYQKVL